MRNHLHTIGLLTLLGYLLLITNSACRDWDVEPPVSYENTWYMSYLKIKTITAGSAELSWDGYSPNPEFGIEGYKIDKQIDNGEVLTIATLGADEKSYLDTALNTKEHSYIYTVYGFADNMLIEPMSKISKVYDFACGFDKYTDPRDGNTYNTMSDGYYCWFAENLKYLPEVYPPGDLMKDNSRYFVYGYQAYDITEAKAQPYYQSYGALYSSASLPDACPTMEGWHVASKDDWHTLINVAGYELEAGGALKETDTLHWKSPNTGATDAYGFKALPGGQLDSSRIFKDIRHSAYFWGAPTSTFRISYNSSRIYISEETINQANSIRCIKFLD